MESACKLENIPFNAKKNHVRCIAHIMNLVVQAILKTINMAALQNESDILEEIEEEKTNSMNLNCGILKVSKYLI